MASETRSEAPIFITWGGEQDDVILLPVAHPSLTVTVSMVAASLAPEEDIQIVATGFIRGMPVHPLVGEERPVTVTMRQSPPGSLPGSELGAEEVLASVTFGTLTMDMAYVLSPQLECVRVTELPGGLEKVAGPASLFGTLLSSTARWGGSM